MTIHPRLSTPLADRYRIERELGQGGMATVYLAHDVRHDRKVALKVLRPELAAVIGAERFLAEIKTTANLQHPHILSLFDSGEADGTVFYVMPYVEGESLRDRLSREHQLPVEEAIQLAREVADALQYAHNHHVIHRDIKPENILLHGGHALVADFGIALAVSRSDGGTRMTETGMSLGTPHYMSPEQAMGEREITGKSDVYALGCVLYEMLVGEPPFTGPTVQAVVARVMTEEPRSLTIQRKTIPPHVEASVRKALQKLSADRFASPAAFADALVHPESMALPTSAGMPAAFSASSVAWKRRFVIAAALGTLATVVAVLAWIRSARIGSAGPDWSYLNFGDSLQVQTNLPALAYSPDGSTIVIKSDVQNGRLWLKRRADLNPTPIPGTERATSPVFSPDGKWIAFIRDGQVRKVGVDGGGAVTLADTAFNLALTWLDDGSLIYSPTLFKLSRISSAGGPSTVVLEDSTLFGLAPSGFTPLPGGRGILLTSCNAGCVSMTLLVLDLKTRTQHTLLPDVAQGWYLPGGRLLYVRRDGTAMVAPFDLDKLQIAGAAVPVLEGVLVSVGFAQLAWSPSGSLLYVRGEGLSPDQLLFRVTRDGAVAPLDTSWVAQFTSPVVSRDGRRIAVGVGGTVSALNIWVRSMDRGPATRLTFGGQDRRPAWSPDGRLIAFVRDTAAGSVVMARPADGAGSDRLLARLDRIVQEVAWSPDGQWLVLRTDNGAAGAGDLIGVRTSGDTTPVSLVASPFTELHPAVSPDGRWLAYCSNESGRNEIYVRPFPNTDGGRWQVSSGTGNEPRWSGDGRELFYLDDTRQLMATRIGSGPSFSTGETRRILDASGFTGQVFHQSYDVAPDGRSFLFVGPRKSRANSRGPQVVRVDNWFADLKARVKR